MARSIKLSKLFSFDSKIGYFILSIVQNYNHKKYWARRKKVIDPSNKVPLLIKLYFLYYIKRTDAYHNCSFGTNLNSGALFSTPPQLPHGPKGIIVGHDTVIGENCRIFQQVTIAHGNVIIGNNVKIGANAVVIENVPDNATVVLPKSRIIIK